MLATALDKPFLESLPLKGQATYVKEFASLSPLAAKYLKRPEHMVQVLGQNLSIGSLKLYSARFRPGSGLIPGRYRLGVVQAWDGTDPGRYRPGTVQAWDGTGSGRYRPGTRQPNAQLVTTA